jgi:hypothetical protein
MTSRADGIEWEFPPFSFSVGVRKIMIHFVVKTLSHLVAAMPRQVLCGQSSLLPSVPGVARE